MGEFGSLFTPIKIGSLKLDNRIVMPPMATYFANYDGSVNERHVAYYLARAKGGAGYVTFEHTGVLKQGRAFSRMALLDSDQQIPYFRKLVEAIHSEGGKIIIQINHAGRQTLSSYTGSPIVGPSSLACPVLKEIPHALTHAEIQEIIEAFGQAAWRVRETGADGVEIHMAHGYLLNQFLSPFSNKRVDEYGGDFERRMRMPIEVLRMVRNRVGSDFPVVCRLSADEFVERGLTIEVSKEIARILEKNGTNALHISATVAASGHLNPPSYYLEEGCFVHLAHEIKCAVSVPVITVGRIRTPELANQIIKEGKADLVSMGRALIADPQLPNKTLQGKKKEIIPCISCNRCSYTNKQGGLRCAVNPETGYEAEFKVRKADHPKIIWVIGGGPAGMKAAEIAAKCGHEVTLYEKGSKLGGQFLLAAIPPRKKVFQEFIDYLTEQLYQLRVRILKGKSFDSTFLEKEKPDVVIVATGARPYFPSIDGIKESKIYSVWDALSNLDHLGRKILVVGGGGVGCEVVDHLSENGRQVMLIEMRESIGMDLVVHLRESLSKRLKEKEVQILTSAKVIRFEKDGVWVEDVNGLRKLGGFDSIVISLGSTANGEIVESIKEKVPIVLTIGDASSPREILYAIYEGEEAALRIESHED